MPCGAKFDPMDPLLPTAEDERFMREAIRLGEKAALVDGTGGPFGCVIVKDGKIIAEGSNQVVSEKDPTWHGEMEAIRAAAKKLGAFDLSGCTLYTTGEPCPMCAGPSSGPASTAWSTPRPSPTPSATDSSTTNPFTKT
jgi:hypothetical protein